MYRRIIYSSLAGGALLCALFLAANRVEDLLEDTPNRSWGEIVASDTLRVGTLRTSVSAFKYMGRWHGFEYENVAQVASELGLTLDLHLMHSEEELYDSLSTGFIDLVAWPSIHEQMPTMADFRRCGYLLPTSFWLGAFSDSTFLNSRVGQAALEQTPDTLSWMVSCYSDTLAAKIDSVCRFVYTVPAFGYTTRYCYQMSNEHKGGKFKVRRKEDGSLTGYDELFVQYADSVDWDWLLLASLAMHESDCTNDLVSNRGAEGIMQIMPSAGEDFGCSPDSLMDVECNIRTASRMIRHMEWRLRRRIARTKQPDLSRFSEADSTLRAEIEKDLIWFTLASYNAGLGHVFDAIALADSLGYDPAVWEYNVEHCLRLMRQPAYYNLPCVHLGKFNAAVTLRYIHDVVDMADFLRSRNIKPVIDND